MAHVPVRVLWSGLRSTRRTRDDPRMRKPEGLTCPKGSDVTGPPWRPPHPPRVTYRPVVRGPAARHRPRQVRALNLRPTDAHRRRDPRPNLRGASPDEKKSDPASTTGPPWSWPWVDLRRQAHRVPGGAPVFPRPRPRGRSTSSPAGRGRGPLQRPHFSFGARCARRGVDLM
jgi:hypothetical protein